MSNGSVLVIYYRKSMTPSGLDWAVQCALDRLVGVDATVTLIVPADLDLSFLVVERAVGAKIKVSRLPPNVFEFTNRVLLLHEIEKAINLVDASGVFSFGIRHCGYCGAMASRLQGAAHICVLTYRDLFEYHLNNPQELEFVLASSQAVGSFNGRAVDQARAFGAGEDLMVLKPPDPPDLRLLAGEDGAGERLMQPYVLTCGLLSPLTDLDDLVQRADLHLGDRAARWIHAGVIDPSVLAPFCARLSGLGMLERFSVLGVLKRHRLLETMKGAGAVLLSAGEHDTGILERECAILGIPAEVPAELDPTPHACSIEDFLRLFGP